MTADNTKPWENPEIRLASGPQYLAGYVISLFLMGISLLLVLDHSESSAAILSTVTLIAFVSVGAQLILLFHLDFSETQRWNTITLMMNVPLLILSVGLTLWMFSHLYGRVMAPAMVH